MVAVTLSAEVKPLPLAVASLPEVQVQAQVGGTQAGMEDEVAVTGVDSVDDHIARLKANARQHVEREMTSSAPQSKNPYLPSREVARTIACRFFPNCTYGDNCIFWHPSSMPSVDTPPDANAITEDGQAQAAYMNGGYDMQYAQLNEQQQPAAQQPQMMYYPYEGGEYNPYAPAQMYASPPPPQHQHQHSLSHSSHHSRSQSHGQQQQQQGQGQPSQQNGTNGNGYYGFVPYAAQHGVYAAAQQQPSYYQNGAAAYPGGMYMLAMQPGMEDQLTNNGSVLSPGSTSSTALMQDPAIIAQGPESVKSPVAGANGASNGENAAATATVSSGMQKTASNQSNKSSGSSSKKSKKASPVNGNGNGENTNGGAPSSNAAILSPTSSNLQASQPEFLPQHIPYYPSAMPMQLPGMPPEMMMMMMPPPTSPLSPGQNGQAHFYGYPQQPYMQQQHLHAHSSGLGNGNGHGHGPMPASLETDFAKVSLAANGVIGEHAASGGSGVNGQERSASSPSSNSNQQPRVHTFFQTSGENLNTISSAPGYVGPPANAPRAPRAMNGVNGINGAAAPFVNGKYNPSNSTGSAAALSASHPNGQSKRGTFPPSTGSTNFNASSSSSSATRSYIPLSSLAPNGLNAASSASRRGLDKSTNSSPPPTIPCRYFEMKSCRHGDYCHYTHLLLEERPLPVVASPSNAAAAATSSSAGEDVAAPAPSSEGDKDGEETQAAPAPAQTEIKTEVKMTRDARRLGLNIGAPDGSISERAPKIPEGYRRPPPHHHHHHQQSHHHNTHHQQHNHHHSAMSSQHHGNGNAINYNNNGAPNGFGMPQVNAKGRFVHAQAPSTAAFAQHTQQQQNGQHAQQSPQQQQPHAQAQQIKQDIAKLVNGSSADAEKIQRLISETRNLPSSSPSSSTAAQVSAPRAVNGAAPSQAPRQPNGVQHNSNIPSTLGRRPPAPHVHAHAHRTAGASSAHHVQQRVPSGENDFPALSSGPVAPVAPVVARSATSMERSASASSAAAAVAAGGKDKKSAESATVAAEAAKAPTSTESVKVDDKAAQPASSAPAVASTAPVAPAPAPAAAAPTPAKPAFSWASAAAKAASLPTPPPKRPVSKQRPSTNGKDSKEKEGKAEKAKKGEKNEKAEKIEKSDKAQAPENKAAPAAPAAATAVEAATPSQAITAETVSAPALKA